MTAAGKVLNAMIRYYTGDPLRINHFIKVWGFAKAIGESEGLDAETLGILEIAALTHDIGIKNCEEKYGNADGALQQLEGPPEAEILLETEGINGDIIGRVCWLIAHHHTYSDIQGTDYRILVEADFLVNAFEGGMSADAIKSFGNKVFATSAGKRLLAQLYPAATGGEQNGAGK